MTNLMRFVIEAADPRGRADRRGLFVMACALIAYQVICLSLVAADVLAADGLAIKLLKFIGLWFGITATAKRLHDLGYSAWTMLAAFAAITIWASLAVLSVMITFGMNAMLEGGIGYAIALASTSLPILAAAFWLHLSTGNEEVNRFGTVPDASGFSYPGREELAASASA